MAIIKSFSPFQNLSNFSTFIVDRNPNSDFFRITEFKETFSGGKNGFLIEGSEFLKETTEVKIEILDVEGNPVYFEPGKGVPEYYEGVSSLISVHIYPDTPIGIGKITVLGELKEYINENGTLLPIPNEWKGVYNVKWERTFKINRNISNEDTVRFYRRPIVSITELVKPIFSKTIPSVTQSGSLEGIALQPTAGSNLTNWTAGTSYKLKITDGTNWTASVDENSITIPSLGYSPVVREVLNNKEVLVDIPYSVGNIVQNFPSTPYITSFEYLEGQTVTDSSLTGSFAKINISNLKTFVGDVARVKVFRKSRNEVTDFQFVQESKLEASELLRDITISTDTEISYGNFTETNLSNYWITSSNQHPVSINVDVLQSSVKTDYNFLAGGIQQLITSESFSITKDVEYTLTFKTLISGSLNGSEYLRGYLSSSDGYQQTFLTVSGSDIFKTRQIVTQNIIANPISVSNAKLVFDISGSDWYISSVSLKNAQETSFSPDEFLLIQDIPRKLASETFDFRFEFYDINNNYIPVDVVASATFDGGNDFPTSGKLLNFESDRTAFRFSTGSLGNPPFQQIQFKTTAQNLTGSITFASAAFDINGNYINPGSYSGTYPGLLTNVTPAGALLTIANFSGSDTSYTVGSIVYTASLDDLEEFETIFRLEDGENAPQLIVTSNANQFIYEPTTLSPKPAGQGITVRAHRKNLASLSTPITINSGSNRPGLTYVDTVNGIDTYTISAIQFSASFASNNFDEVTYQFTASDVFGNQQTDEITLSKVINFDGVSLVLSNEATTFPAFSNGNVIGGFSASSGSVQMFIGGNQILHDDISGGRLKNTFDITSVVGSGVTPTSTSPTNQFYSISAMSADSGSLTLNIEYLAGDSSTSQSFQKVVSYSKAKRGVPNVEVAVTPAAQSIQSNSRGSGSAVPQSLIVTALEGGVSRFTSLGTPTYTNGLAGSVSTNTIVFSSNASSMTSDSGTITIPVNFTDSEGTSGTKNVVATVSRVRSSVPNVVLTATPQAQSVLANSSGTQTGTLSNVTIDALEGSTSRFTSMVISSTSGFSTPPFVSSNILVMTSAVMNAAEGSVTLTVTHTDSEGTSGQTKTIVVRTTKVNIGADGADGVDGVDGADGAPGADGADGANGVVINVTPTSQVVKRSTSGTYATPSTFRVTVSENGSLLTHQVGSGTPATSRFTITSLLSGSESSGAGTTSYIIQPITPTTTAGFETTFNVTYTDSKGTTSSAIAQLHRVNVVLDGTTGPGVVHTGVWEVGRAYQYSDGLTAGTGRRDTVLWSSTGSPPYDTYYATNTSHTSTNDSSPSTGRPDLGGPWTSLGTQDFFVAAKIGVFEDSFVQNTLNIGTNNNGGVSSANITLAGGSSNPYISIGQSGTIGSQGYNINGIFLGQDGGVSKLSLKSNSNSLLWDGTTLSVNGSGTFTGTVSGGSILGGTIDIGGNDSTSFHVDSSGQMWLGNASFASAPFRVTAGGSVTATAGDIAGWNIDSTKISKTSTGTIEINSSDLGFFIKDGSRNAVIMTDDTSFRITSSTSALSDFSGTSSTGVSGPIFGQNLQSEASTTFYSNNVSTGVVSAGTEVSMTDVEISAMISNSLSTSYLMQISTATYVQTYHWISLEVVGVGEALIASGYVFYNGSTYERSITSTGGASIVIASGGTYNVRIKHQIGVNYLIGGESITLKTPNFSGVNAVIGSAPRSVEICQAGLQSLYGSNLFKVDTSLSATNFLTVRGSSSFSGLSSFSTLSATNGAITNLSVGEISISSGVLTINGDIRATGDIYALTSSDKRLKENIIPIANPIEKIMKIGGYTFNWNGLSKKSKNIQEVGVMAQEIQEVMPEVVREKGDGYLGVDYEKIVALLIEGIKQQQGEIGELKNEILLLKKMLIK